MAMVAGIMGMGINMGMGRVSAVNNVVCSI
jgi:hypothetical protein